MDFAYNRFGRNDKKYNTLTELSYARIPQAILNKYHEERRKPKELRDNAQIPRQQPQELPVIWKSESIHAALHNIVLITNRAQMVLVFFLENNQLKKGSSTFSERIYKVEKKLPMDDGFVRISKSTIVNKKHVVGVDKDQSKVTINYHHPIMDETNCLAITKNINLLNP